MFGSRLDERGRRLFAAVEVRAGAPRSWGWRVRRSIGARMISMLRHCLRGASGARAAGDRRQESRDQTGPAASDQAGDARRSDASSDLGVQEPGEAGLGFDGDGLFGGGRYGPRGAVEARVLAPGQSQGQGRIEPSRSGRAIRLHRWSFRRKGEGSRSSRLTTRRKKKRKQDCPDRRVDGQTHNASNEMKIETGQKPLANHRSHDADACVADKSKACPARNLARKISAARANEQDRLCVRLKSARGFPPIADSGTSSDIVYFFALTPRSATRAYQLAANPVLGQAA